MSALQGICVLFAALLLTCNNQVNSLGPHGSPAAPDASMLVGGQEAQVFATAGMKACVAFLQPLPVGTPTQVARAVPLPAALAAAAGGPGEASSAGVTQPAGVAFAAAARVAAVHELEGGREAGDRRGRLLAGEAAPLSAHAAHAADAGERRPARLRGLLAPSSPDSSSPTPPRVPAASPGPAAAAPPGSQAVHPCRPTIRAVARQQPELQQLRALAAAGYDMFAVDGNKPFTVLAPSNTALQALAAGACGSRARAAARCAKAAHSAPAAAAPRSSAASRLSAARAGNTVPSPRPCLALHTALAHCCQGAFTALLASRCAGGLGPLAKPRPAARHPLQASPTVTSRCCWSRVFTAWCSTTSSPRGEALPLGARLALL